MTVKITLSEPGKHVVLLPSFKDAAANLIAKLSKLFLEAYFKGTG